MTDFVTDLAAAARPIPALRRRAFLRVAGASAASAALVLAGCGKDKEPAPVVPPDPNLIALQTGDLGVLNYCYLFKQAQVALYQRVVEAFPADFTAADRLFFADLRDHEVVQRMTLFSALGNNFLPQLTFAFPAALTTRAAVLAQARRLEDASVAALAGAVPLLASFDLRGLLAKMLSVEARHAALVRELAAPGTFAGPDVVTDGRNKTLTPVQGVAEIAPLYAPVVVSVANLPLG